MRNDAEASPTGFPFKVARLPGTLSDPQVYGARPRQCDLGYLRAPYLTENGHVGYRCAAEDADTYVRKGGDRTATAGRICLCNALTATVGLGQTRSDGYEEPALVTLGSDIEGVQDMATRRPAGWTAADAVDYLVSG